MSNYDIDKDTADLIDSFLIDGEYLDGDDKPDLNAWMRDSDYLYCDGDEFHAPCEWVDLDDNPVDPIITIMGAIEACGYRRPWSIVIAFDADGDSPYEAIEEWVIHNGADMLPVIDCENPLTGYRPLG